MNSNYHILPQLKSTSKSKNENAILKRQYHTCSKLTRST